MDLFNALKEQETKAPAKAKKDNKLRITAETKQETVKLFQDIKRKAELKALMDQYKAELDEIDTNLKDFGKQAFLEQYKQTGRNPGTFVLQATDKDKVAECMYITMDKYLKIDKEDSDALKEDYPEMDLVEEDTQFTIAPAMLQKYGKEISDFVLKSKKIADEDRMKIITPKTTYAIKKGTIDVINQDDLLEELYERVQPINQLKTPSVK